MSDNDGVLFQELHSIKMLLLLQTLAAGYQQKDVAAALGVSDATLSRMLPKGLSKDKARKGK